TRRAAPATRAAAARMSSVSATRRHPSGTRRSGVYRGSTMPADAALEALLEVLTPPQREAVTHGEGPLLILAGAGSGKTRVLTHRSSLLIYTDQAQAGEILAITFTNKAASEMRERVEALLGHATRGMWLLPFHSAC